MTTPQISAEQPSLFPVPLEESPPHICQSSSPPRPTTTADTLLAEIERDWWSLLDPRNWRGKGPTDDEILARYRVAGTPAAGEWPNISGSRMYSLVWPSLRLTYNVSEDRLLAACHTCQSHSLLAALTHTRANAVTYSISADLIDAHIWNGDSWTTYTALARFAGQPVASLESLVTDALQLALAHASAALHLALAARNLPSTQIQPSRRTKGQEHSQTIETTVTLARDRLAMLHRCRRSSSPTHTLLEHATIGPRFQDPAWPTLTPGDSLPDDLIKKLLLSHTP